MTVTRPRSLLRPRGLHLRHRAAQLLIFLLLFSPGFYVFAQPWMDTGDIVLRHDVQLLADEGHIRAPITTWPLSWGDIAREINRIDEDALSPAARAAHLRLKRRAREASRVRRLRSHARLAVGNPRPLRTFENTPREKGEIEAGAEWMGERFAFRLQGTGAFEPDDDQNLRLDGSYAGFVLGNWMFSASMRDRWWGPGWDGALIVSSNARPVPMLALERNYSDPFDFPVLRWFGPWKFTTFMGLLESDRVVPNPWLFGMRLNFRPFNGDLELGVSRNVQACGDGQSCDFSTFFDVSAEDETVFQPSLPGNQLAGADVRWASPFSDHPYALYAEGIGEDVNGALPPRDLLLFGIETWGAIRNSSFRIHLEYANTTAREISKDPPLFNFAYNHPSYPYRYRGRPIGHTIDNDGEVISLGAKLIDSDGGYWNVVVRSVKLNRDDAGLNAVSLRARDILNVELSNQRDFLGMGLLWGLGLDRVETEGFSETDTDIRFFVELTVPL